MDDHDAYFTQAIVGAPTSLMLGRRMSPGQARAQGIEVRLDTGLAALTSAWRDGTRLGQSHDFSGRPRRRPGRWMLWLERHALHVAMLGALSLAGSLVLLGVRAWL